MPKNPHWTRDELILALDLYFDGERRQLDPADPRVISLSHLLNNLPLHPVESRVGSFRSPMSVSMKLGNFLSLDPAYPGLGLYRGSRLDQQIWDQFAHDLPRLQATADSIRRLHDDPDAAAAPAGLEDLDESFLEGNLLARIHRRRERNRTLVRRKKEQVLRKQGKLICEVCSFDFVAFYGPTGINAAECHHRVPLAQLGGKQETKLSDLAIVCPTCHRMLHYGSPPPSIAELQSLISKYHLMGRDA